MQSINLLAPLKIKTPKLKQILHGCVSIWDGVIWIVCVCVCVCSGFSSKINLVMILTAIAVIKRNNRSSFTVISHVPTQDEFRKNSNGTKSSINQVC